MAATETKTPEAVYQDYKKQKNKELITYTLFAVGFIGGVVLISKIIR